MGYQGHQLAHSRYSRDMCQLCLRITQRILRVLALSYIHDSADKPGEAAVLSDDRMPETLEVLCRSVRKNDSIVHFKFTSFANRAINRLLDESSVPGVNPFQELGIRGLSRLRIEAKDAEVFLRPEELAGGNIP